MVRPKTKKLRAKKQRGLCMNCRYSAKTNFPNLMVCSQSVRVFVKKSQTCEEYKNEQVR